MKNSGGLQINAAYSDRLTSCQPWFETWAATQRLQWKNVDSENKNDLFGTCFYWAQSRLPGDSEKNYKTSLGMIRVETSSAYLWNMQRCVFHLLSELQDGRLDLQQIVTRGWAGANVHHIVRLVEEMHCWGGKRVRNNFAVMLVWNYDVFLKGWGEKKS